MVLNYQPLLDQLKKPLHDLQLRCTQLDKTVKQTENHFFAFGVHHFNKQSLTLQGYFQQVDKTYQSFVSCVQKKMNDATIKYESERFISQFKMLLQLIKELEKGNATVLYQSYSPIKEKIYQQLHKQYQYEHRLIAMRAEQEELIIQQFGDKLIYTKEKIQALKIRLQKCNTFTQKLEFQLEALNDE
ncbi:MAG: primosomal replication protein [Psychromonas sp.]|nr:primosomal replication protein [Psychromonas sp.]